MPLVSDTLGGIHTGHQRRRSDPKSLTPTAAATGGFSATRRTIFPDRAWPSFQVFLLPESLLPVIARINGLRHVPIRPLAGEVCTVAR